MGPLSDFLWFKSKIGDFRGIVIMSPLALTVKWFESVSLNICMGP